MPQYLPQDVSDALDALGQTVGAILIRTADGWTELPPGPAGYVLTSTGETTPPEWRPPP